MTPALRADAVRNRARILDAAEAVFAERGSAGSTEAVAARAGVAIGTVFRHFPTKTDLLAAILKRLQQQLVDQVDALRAGGDPATALFDFCTHLVERAAAQKTVVDLLAGAGVEVAVGPPVQALREAVQGLLTQAQQAGAVRPDVLLDEVMALLASVCQGALSAGWDQPLQRRILAIVFQGLR